MRKSWRALGWDSYPDESDDPVARAAFDVIAPVIRLVGHRVPILTLQSGTIPVEEVWRLCKEISGLHTGREAKRWTKPKE